MTAPRTKPTIPEVAPLIRAYYQKAGNAVGGSLHVVLDDGNLNNSSIHYCRRYAQEKGDTDGVQIAELLLQMSRTQRCKLADTNWYLPSAKPAWHFG